MKYMTTYDLMESIRNTNEWMGATARAMAAYNKIWLDFFVFSGSPEDVIYKNPAYRPITILKKIRTAKTY